MGPPAKTPGPSGTELLKNDVVKGVLAKAFEKSSPGDKKHAHEEGGWGYLYPTTGQIIVRWATPGPKGTGAGARPFFEINLQNPPTVPGAVLIFKFHTHPITKEWMQSYNGGKGWPAGPSEDDKKINNGVPELLIDGAGTYSYGTDHRRDLGGRPDFPRR